MIILDTNIVSVLMSKNHPDLAMIEAWQRSSADQDFFDTAVTWAEISFGVAILPEGTRKQSLAKDVIRFRTLVSPMTLSFGALEAMEYGQIMASRRAAGRPMGIMDAQIAAIAKVAGATIATRNTEDFRGCGIPLVNPYDAVA